MKELKIIQKVAIVAGLSYGMWLGSHINATDSEIRSAFVIIVLTIIVLLSMIRTNTKPIEE